MRFVAGVFLVAFLCMNNYYVMAADTTRRHSLRAPDASTTLLPPAIALLNNTDSSTNITDTTAPTKAPSDASAPATTTTAPATSTSCSPNVDRDVYKLYLNNQLVYQDCHAKGNHSFPFDGFFSTKKLLAMSQSSACLLICKAIMKIVEKECDIGRLPVRSAAETILKTAQDFKDDAQKTKETMDAMTDATLEQIILTRRNDVLRQQTKPLEDAVANTSATLSETSIQYQKQIEKQFEQSGIAMISPELVILNREYQNESATVDGEADALKNETSVSASEPISQRNGGNGDIVAVEASQDASGPKDRSAEHVKTQGVASAAAAKPLQWHGILSVVASVGLVITWTS